MAACLAVRPGLPTSSPPCRAGVILCVCSFPPSSRALPEPVVLGALEPQRTGTVTVSLPALSPLLGRVLGTQKISVASGRA